MTSAESVQKVLRTVSITEAFHFFTDIGQQGGKFCDLTGRFLGEVENATIDVDRVPL